MTLSKHQKGLLKGIGAFAIWGVGPLYWRLLRDQVPAYEILCHRIVWALLSLILLLQMRGELRQTALKFRNTSLKLALLSASLLAFNWFLFIWGINAGYVLECSLGYFISPFMHMLCGIMFEKERLRKSQLLALSLAAAGVGYRIAAYGRPPWIALLLAVSFALYGALRKRSHLRPLEGLTIETSLVSLPALLFIFWRTTQGIGAFGASGVSVTLLLIGAGPFTAIPLLLFGSSVKTVQLTTIGILQYIAPTLQFVSAVLVFKESFSSSDLGTFGLIWAAILLYSAESLYFSRKKIAVPMQKDSSINPAPSATIPK